MLSKSISTRDNRISESLGVFTIFTPCHFHVKLGILLNELLDASEIEVNAFQIEKSFLQVKLQSL